MQTATGRRQGLIGVGVATALVALLSWVVLLAVARALGASGYADFSVFWGLLFGVLGALVGLQQETTRGVAARRLAGVPEAAPGARPLLVGLGVGLAVAGCILGSSVIWGRSILGDAWVALVLAAAVGAIGFSGQSTFGGVLAGRGRWGGFAWVLTAEAVLRLLVVVWVAVAGGALGGFAWATVCGSFAWVVFLGHGNVRELALTRTDVRTRVFLRRCLHSMAGSGSSALLVNGFPVLLAATAEGRPDARTGILLAAVMVTRAPLLMPLNAYQGALISRFVSHRGQVLREAVRPVLGLALLTVVGAGTAAVVGPLLFGALFGAEFVARGVVLAGLVVAAGFLALLTVSGAAVLAAERHGVYAGGWLLAAAATTAVLATPLPLETRTILGLCVGPVCGVVLHCVPAVMARRASQGAA